MRWMIFGLVTACAPAVESDVTCADGGPPTTFLPDEDRDGFGDDAHPASTCTPPDDPPPGGDCDDENGGVRPGAPDDQWNDVDDDCDGVVDEDVGFELQRLSPRVGGRDGAGVAVIGGSFDDAVEVWFDGVRATARERSQTVIHVDSPPHGPGVVDVEIRRGDRVDRLVGAYTYVDHPKDRRAYGTLSYVDYVGAYDSVADELVSTVVITEPWDLTIHELWQGGLALDTCMPGSGGVYVVDLPGAADVPGAVSFAGDAGTVALAGDTTYPYLFTTSKVSPTQGADGAAYSFVATANGAWPGVTVADAVWLPQRFTITSPSLQATTKVPQEIALAWGGGAPADYVLVSISLTGGTTAPSDDLRCVAADDGAFTVPASAWTAWAADKALVVRVARALQTESVLPDGSKMATIGYYTMIGAATTE